LLIPSNFKNGKFEGTYNAPELRKANCPYRYNYYDIRRHIQTILDQEYNDVNTKLFVWAVIGARRRNGYTYKIIIEEKPKDRFSNFIFYMTESFRFTDEQGPENLDYVSRMNS
jgi:hypothetical protein